MTRNRQPSKSASLRDKMQNILASILQTEIDAEIMETLEKARIDRLREHGEYAVVFNRQSELVVQGIISDDGEHFVEFRPEVEAWLRQQLPDRYSLHQNMFLITVEFGEDREAATLFSLFWT